ncbi:hypothetical protein Esti_004522 [Eimeria stiedai]
MVRAAGGPSGPSEGPLTRGAPRGPPRKKTNWLIAFLVGACVGLAIWPLLLSVVTLNLLRQWGEGPTTAAGPPGGPSVGPPSVGPPNQHSPAEPPEESMPTTTDARASTAAAAAAKAAAAARRQQQEGPPVKMQKFKPLRFSDLAGKLLLLLLLAKLELQEVVECLRAPEKFRRLGARLPRGLLLVGPPGTGKTALARAVATEAGVPLLYASGSEFVEVYVGQGARRVRQLFAAARRGAPLILFIDELDAVGGRRGPGGAPGGGREHEQTLNQLLVEMDGFQGGGEGVVVLAATNRVDALDPALLRPGRFDRVVHVPLPDRRARELILLKYISKVPVEAPEEKADQEETVGEGERDRREGPAGERRQRPRKEGVLAPPAAQKTNTSSSSSGGDKGRRRPGEIEGKGDGSIHKALASQLAKLTPGFSGAELENLVNEAAILAARANKRHISVSEFLEARDKVTLGPSRGSRLQSALQRRVTATHEAGHAVVAFFLQPSADPIHKATIVSRGNALGLVEQLPVDDRYGASFSELFARLCVCMGGRAAERIAFGDEAVSTGASSDIRTATHIAYNMVASWGMSRQMGPLAYGAAARTSFISSETARQIELEVKSLVTAAEARASALLRRHWWSVFVLTEALLERETLTGEEIASLIDPRGSWEREVSRQRSLQLKRAQRKPAFWERPLWGGPTSWLGALWHRLKGAFRRKPPDNRGGPPGPPLEGPPSTGHQWGNRELPLKDISSSSESASQEENVNLTAAADAAAAAAATATAGTAAEAELQQQGPQGGTSRCSTCSSTSSSSGTSSDSAADTPQILSDLAWIHGFPVEANLPLQQLKQRLLLRQRQQQQHSSMPPETGLSFVSLPDEPALGGLGPQLADTWQQQLQQQQHAQLEELQQQEQQQQQQRQASVFWVSPRLHDLEM